MKIIVGLGNIGNKYLKNRHNVGFIALDILTQQFEKEGIAINWKEEKKLKATTAKVPYGDEILYLVKPSTLMNLSGQAVNQILNFFKEPAANLVVIYDDIDLPLGEIRMREKGSAGTHNGMKSIIQEIGTQEFKRIRIGIESRGELSPKQQDLSSFVLSDFREEEIPLLVQGVNKTLAQLSELISA